MKYFTMEELCDSVTAKKKGIANIPDDTQKANLEALVDAVLDPLREEYGKPIYVNSGFRSEALNEAIRGASNSQHLKGEAADLSTGTKSGNKVLFEFIQELKLPFDQFIDEAGFGWIHVSHKRTGRNRKQVLHL